MRYNIRTLVGKNCMTPEYGQKVYAVTYPELVAERPLELDFAKVDIFASPFFNFAIGQLLRDIQPETLNRHLTVSNLNPVGKQILRRVIENSKQYYSNERFRKTVDEVLSEQANTP